jgi:hypothetical protein
MSRSRRWDSQRRQWFVHGILHRPNLPEYNLYNALHYAPRYMLFTNHFMRREVSDGTLSGVQYFLTYGPMSLRFDPDINLDSGLDAVAPGETLFAAAIVCSDFNNASTNTCCFAALILRRLKSSEANDFAEASATSDSDVSQILAKPLFRRVGAKMIDTRGPEQARPE